MKPQAPGREVLVFTNTSFAKRQLCERNETSHKGDTSSLADQLKKACWSGLVFEMLPDLFTNNDRKNLSVWKVSQAEQFLHIELSSKSSPTETGTSIDPYFFLPLVVWHN